MNTVRELMDYLHGKRIYVYGAGKIAKRLKRRLDQNQIAVQGYLVTDRSGNVTEIDGVSVSSAKEIANSARNLNDFTIVIAIEKGQLDILDYVLELGFCNVIRLEQNVIREMRIADMLDECNTMQKDYNYTLDYAGIEEYHCAVLEKDTGRMLFKTFIYRVMENPPATVEKCRLSAFEKLYGSYHKLPFAKEPGISNEIAAKHKLEIYAAISHLDKRKGIEIKAEGVIPLQVGAALTSIRMGYLTDDTGDNISAENKNYCECTGLYWIWKNTHGQKYVGLSHYRRRFRWDATAVEYIMKNDIDAVVTVPIFAPCPVIEFFDSYICRYDWKLLREAVTKYDSAYAELLEPYEQSNFYISCNLAIFKREWFDKYCEFAFTISEQIDSEYKKRQIRRQDRYMGYLFENLLSLFLIRHQAEMKIMYADMDFIS